MKHRSENAERSFSNAVCREENIVVDARSIKINITETLYKGVMMILLNETCSGQIPVARLSKHGNCFMFQIL